MATMQVSVLRKAGDIGVEEREVPTPGRGEVLVEIGSVGVCGSDVHYYEHGRIGRYVVDAPLVLGHEAGGVVVEVGPEVSALQPGQRVSIEPGVPCRRCRQCLAGRYNLCPDVRFFATPPYDGAFCQYLVMPAEFVFPCRTPSATTPPGCSNRCRSASGPAVAPLSRPGPACW